MMTIISKLTRVDFVNASFVIFYSRLIPKIYTGIGLLVALISLVSILFNARNSLTFFYYGLLIVVILPAFVYFNALRGFSSQNRLSETIEYRFEEDYLKVGGQSFTSELTWNKVYKVTLKKNWLLIWANAQFATPIRRTDVWDREITDLKRILNHHKVKNNL